MNGAEVALIMGSLSDRPALAPAAERLSSFSVSYIWQVVSAHRTPLAMLRFAEEAKEQGFRVIIAAAGGAAHLPGMVAAVTTLPVIGVPVLSERSLQGWDSVLSVLQMPAGVPVATMALNGAENAAILAVQILALQNTSLADQLQSHKKKLQDKVAAQNNILRNQKK